MPRWKADKRDPEYTTRCFLIDQHYEDRRADLTWDVPRLERLCKMVGMTPMEIAAFYRVPFPAMRGYLRDNRFPGMLELHLTILEQSVFPAAKPFVMPAP